MRWPLLILFILLLALQHPLWEGKGSWTQVREIDRQLKNQQALNQELELRNASMAAEVHDLKTGLEAIEERARFELGLIRGAEIFVQIPGALPSSSVPPSGAKKEGE
jgi:cell division protein FtsB